MNILALCTSSTSGSIAVFKEDHISFISYLDIKVTHSERLLPQINFGLKQSGLSIQDIDLIAYANGPGSFTGIRIGLATAKGFALANQIPIIPINTLELLAANLINTERAILVMIDAKMHEIYGALYSPDKKIIIPPENAKPEFFLQKIQSPVVIIGDIQKKFSSEITKAKIDYIFAPAHLNFPLASGLITISKKMEIPKFDFNSVANLEPFYLRRSQAELMKKSREKK